MSLATGRTIHGNIRTVLPVGEDVIDRVHQIALEEKQPLISKNFRYEWRLGNDVAEEMIMKRKTRESRNHYQ